MEAPLIMSRLTETSGLT